MTAPRPSLDGRTNAPHLLQLKYGMVYEFPQVISYFLFLLTYKLGASHPGAVLLVEVPHQHGGGLCHVGLSI